MPVNNQSRYPLRVAPKPKRRTIPTTPFIPMAGLLLAVILVSGGTLLLPQVVSVELAAQQAQPVTAATVASAFPVSVDASTKTIVDNPQADAFYKAKTSAVAASGFSVNDLINLVASLIDNTNVYQSMAAVAGINNHLVTIKPGYRTEEVVTAFSNALNWNKSQQQEFITGATTNSSGLTDGIFSPGTYLVNTSMTPSSVAALMNVAFNRNILIHYGTTTAAHVPLSQALTVASLLEREAGGPTDMRIISGIIWNRLFNNMNLQIDATLQYAMGESKSGNWWQAVLPKDKYVKSPYNTYANEGLPPGPIASPSLAAVLAALNPVKTSCLFYFHDAHGNFHCSDTYAEHVALLKKYYGQGK